MTHDLRTFFTNRFVLVFGVVVAVYNFHNMKWETKGFHGLSKENYSIQAFESSIVHHWNDNNNVLKSYSVAS